MSKKVRASSDDIIRSTLAEVLLFLLFIFLIWLGADATQRIGSESQEGEKEDNLALVQQENANLREIVAELRLSVAEFAEQSEKTEELEKKAALASQLLFQAKEAEIAIAKDLNIATTKLHELKRQLKEKENIFDNLYKVTTELNEKTQEISDLKGKIGNLNSTIKGLNKILQELKGLKDFEVISAKDFKNFGSGEAILSEEMEAVLRGRVTNWIREKRKAGLDKAGIGGLDISVVEVIGHTDGEPLPGGRTSTLDKTLPEFLSGTSDAPATLIASDNAGLGLMRAVAAAVVLRETLDGEGLVILPYSAGNLISANDNSLSVPYNVEGAVHRRIEIRVR
ncbi:MAG: hypothetical protein ACPGGK_02710 [Pikeienuella sp.]